MGLGWIAILPKKKLLDAKKKIREAERELSTFGSDLLAECKEYEPPAAPSYRRTMTLSRSWEKEGPRRVGGSIEVAVISSGKVAPYNVYVKGPKREPKNKSQAKHMARRGWRSVDEIMAVLWPRSRRKLKTILGRSAVSGLR